jgi:hypothetical protein
MRMATGTRRKSTQGKGPEAWTDPKDGSVRVNMGGEKGGLRRTYPLAYVIEAAAAGLIEALRNRRA